MYLKVSPMRGVHQFGIHGKLAPRYVGPYKILKQCGLVAYRLYLPDNLSAVHNVFHVSNGRNVCRFLMKLWKLKDFPSSLT